MDIVPVLFPSSQPLRRDMTEFRADNGNDSAILTTQPFLYKPRILMIIQCNFQTPNLSPHDKK